MINNPVNFLPHNRMMPSQPQMPLPLRGMNPTQPTSPLPHLNPMTKSPEDDLDSERISYGDDAKQFYYLSYPEDYDADNAKVAVLVHGGAYKAGSPDDTNYKNIEDYFLDNGYIVANMDYRVFDGRSPNLEWPDPITDVADGINNLFDKLETLGINVTDKTYFGSSAGADTGAALLYSDKYDSGEDKIPIFDQFITSGGHKNPTGMTEKDNELLDLWGINSFDEAFNYSFDPASVSTKALIMEGSKDNTDVNALSPSSHLNSFEQFLDDNGVDVDTRWVFDSDYNGHGGPVKAFGDQFKPVMNAIESVLEEPDNNKSKNTNSPNPLISLIQRVIEIVRQMMEIF